ncbi:MAG: ammonia-dependent NAD(+) synthetase [Galactobacter sp.]
MRELQQQIITELGVQPEIDPAQEVARRVKFLQDYLHFAHAKGFVLGISGGIDSSLAGRLAQLAVEGLREQGEDVDFVAVRLPHGVQADEEDAQAALAFIKPRTSLALDVKPSVDGLASAYQDATGSELSDFTRGNTKARMRMAAQYAIAGDRGLLVIGTDHAAESLVGFFTKFGDGGADILPLFGLHKAQNTELLRYLGAPEALATKKPTADLLDLNPGRADEDELGVNYTDVNAYLEGKDVPASVAEALEEKFLRTRHKRTVPVTILDTWWKN